MSLIVEEYTDVMKNETIKANVEALEMLAFSAQFSPWLLTEALDRFLKNNPSPWYQLMVVLLDYLFKGVQ